LFAHEPAPRWIAVWRFRLIVLGIVALIAIGSIYVYGHFVNTEQNPVGAPAAHPTAGR
jgi:hypothetical protein